MKLCSINILSRRVLLFEACVVLKRVDPPTVVVASSRTVGDCVGSPPPVLAQSPRARRIQGDGRQAQELAGGTACGMSVLAWLVHA